jgi:hypothetical protein
MDARPRLPDGLIAVVKQDCATCVLVAPVLGDLAARGQPLTVYTQDDPAFPANVAPVDDRELLVSWHHRIETVPTLLRIENGIEVARTVGWSRSDWETLAGVSPLGAELPAFRPGCGSLSVDPAVADALRVRFDGGRLSSRRIELGDIEDDIETSFVRGWTDGLPVVPPRGSCACSTVRPARPTRSWPWSRPIWCPPRSRRSRSTL